MKNVIKKVIGRKIIKPPFYQYEYTPAQLKKFLLQSKLHPLVITGTDFLYSFTEHGNFSGKNIRENSFAVKFSQLLDNSFLRRLGAQSVTISTKIADEMQCFFCGENNAKKESIKKYTVPVCIDCIKNNNVRYYKRGQKTYYHDKYVINPQILKPEKRKCDFCDETYMTDPLFEDFGFNKNVCPSCLKKPEINIMLSNQHIKPIWRKRK